MLNAVIKNTTLSLGIHYIIIIFNIIIVIIIIIIIYQ